LTATARQAFVSQKWQAWQQKWCLSPISEDAKSCKDEMSEKSEKSDLSDKDLLRLKADG